MVSDTVKDWIESFQDRKGRARAVIEACAVYENDVDASRLAGHAATGNSVHSRVVSALLKPVKKRLGRNKAERRLTRMHAHNPMLGGLGWKPVKEPPLEKISGVSPGPQAPFDLAFENSKTPANQNLSAHIASYAHENYKTMWPHLPELEFEAPPNHTPHPPVANPFRAPERSQRPVVSRDGYLNVQEVWKLYDAMAYAMRKHGVVMNTHVIILWSQMGVTHEEGDALLKDYLHKAQKWLRVGTKSRRYRKANARYEGGELRYVWVHENAANRGFHSHVLCNVPPRLHKAFTAWSRQCLAHAANKPMPWSAFRSVRSYAKTDESAVRRAWSWFRYLTKQLDPKLVVNVWDAGHFVNAPSLRDMIHPWPLRHSPPINLDRLAGVSRNLGQGAQAKDGFRSKLKTGAFQNLYSGDEFDDWRRSMERQCEDARRQQLLKTLQI